MFALAIPSTGAMLCADLMQTLVFYVPPHDLLAVLRDAANILGQDRHCVIARELTKVPKGAMQLHSYAHCSCLN